MSEGKRVLIIDDELDFINIVKERLEFEGYEVISAQDGKMGLELMRKMRVDVAFLDIMMPEMNGFGVLDTIRKEGKSLAKTPVVIVTAYSCQFTKDQKDKLKDVASILYKPFDMSKLLLLLCSLL